MPTGRGRSGMTAGAPCCRRAGSRSGSWPGCPGVRVVAEAAPTRSSTDYTPRAMRIANDASAAAPATKRAQPPSLAAPDVAVPCAEPAAVHRHARARPRAGHLAANGHRFAVGVLERRALPRAGRRTRLVPRIDTSSGSPASFAHSSWENAPTRTHRHAANSLQRHRIDGDIIDVHRPSVSFVG